MGIVGDNGVGKSTLLNLIAGKLQPQAGQLIIGETVRVAYFSQQIEGLDESKRVINYLQKWLRRSRLAVERLPLQSS